MSRSSGAAAELPGSERKKLAVRVLAGSETAVSPDGRVVIFMLSISGREVDGAVARKALEEHFWLPRDADATRTFRTFENGRSRIVAVAQQKLLTRVSAGIFRSRCGTKSNASLSLEVRPSLTLGDAVNARTTMTRASAA